MTDDTPPEQVVRDHVAWENGDETKTDVVSESIDMYNPGLPEGEVHAREPLAKYLREIREGFPDVHFDIEDLAVRDDIVMAEVHITGTHEGEFKGLPPTGRQVEFRAMGKWRVADGKVVECRQYYDTTELPNQLGLTFPEVIGQLPKLAWGKLQATL